MLSTDDLKAIEELFDKGLDPVKERLDKVETRLGSVENRLETVEMKVELLNNKIDDTQKDTIATLTDLIHTGYRMHEERLTKIEDQLKTSQAH
jgi:archaellum component FlaC